MRGLGLPRNLSRSRVLNCEIVCRQRLTSRSKTAEHVAAAAPAEKAILIDCFAGVGGNAIAFAKSGRWKRVYAIEKDAKVLACAKHNAEIYGVQDQISWYEGDCFQVLQKELVDLVEQSVVFASPPWGGKSFLLGRWGEVTITFFAHDRRPRV